MKKIITLILTTICLFTSCLAGCQLLDKSSNEKPNENVAELVANQAHVEKTGYKFCGYFEDANFTKRVMVEQETIPTEYYAKYQPDIEQIMAYTLNEEGIKRPEITFEQPIYAKGSYDDAVIKYKHLFFRDIETMSMATHVAGIEQFLGNGISRAEAVLGGSGINDFVTFHDDSNLWKFNSMTDEGRIEIGIDRNFTWNAYLGDVKGVVDGFEYYIVNDEYAVICGHVGEEQDFTADEYKFPSEIEGKPLREISICVSYSQNVFAVKSLIVPSSVNNFYLIDEGINKFDFEKIIFQEGVKTIKVKSAQKEDYVIPSTAYYVDLQRVDYGLNAPTETYLTKDRKIVVNGGEHYYTDGNFLISKEGDLVHQYAGYEKLDFTVPQGVKRVLRRSIFGLCKNIFISENVEFFSPLFNEYSYRYNICYRSSNLNERQSSLPIIFVNSEKVARTLINDCIKYDVLYGDGIRINCEWMIFDDGIDWKNIAESSTELILPGGIESFISTHENLPVKIEGEIIYRKIYDETQGIFSDEWQICSYLNKSFEKLIEYDGALLGYANIKGIIE